MVPRTDRSDAMVIVCPLGGGNRDPTHRPCGGVDRRDVRGNDRERAVKGPRGRKALLPNVRERAQRTHVAVLLDAITTCPSLAMTWANSLCTRYSKLIGAPKPWPLTIGYTCSNRGKSPARLALQAWAGTVTAPHSGGVGGTTTAAWPAGAQRH